MFKKKIIFFSYANIYWVYYPLLHAFYTLSHLTLMANLSEISRYIKLKLKNKSLTSSHSYFSPRLISYSEYRRVQLLNQALHCMEKSNHKNIYLSFKTFSLLANKCCQKKKKKSLDQNIQANCFMQTRLKDWELNKCLNGNGFVTKYS